MADERKEYVLPDISGVVGCHCCAFWSHAGEVNGIQFGACRVRAPVVMETLLNERVGFGTDERVLISTRFPATAGSTWCGEFRHKDRV